MISLELLNLEKNIRLTDVKCGYETSLVARSPGEVKE